MTSSPRILVSDYDFTLYVNNIIMNYNIYRIKQLRKEGHKFAIATARSYDSIMSEIKGYQIPYDYVSCFDGGALYDNQGNLLYASSISEKNQEIIETINERYEMVKKVTPLRTKAQPEDLIIEYAISFYIKKLADAEQLKELKEYFKGIADLKYSGGLLKYICNKGNDKAENVTLIKQDCKLETAYAIGDGLNDLKMIQNNEGYSMPWSHHEIKKLAVGKTLSVGSLANKITKGKC